MDSRRPSSFVLIAVLLVTGCSSSGGEQQLLQKYFSASKLRDQTTLSNIATVAFHPQRDGIVQEFTIVSVSDERNREVALRGLRKTHDEAKAADEDLTKRKRAYQDANIEAIQRVLKAERDKAPVRGADATVQAAWTKWRTEAAEITRRVSQARNQLADAKAGLEASVYDPRKPVDVSDYDAKVYTKDVVIDAQVMAGGATAPKTLTVTLERVRLRRDNAPDVEGRWIITGIRQGAKPATASS